MPNIVIKERDETGIGSNVASTDVAYVPGFADTNFGVYILNEAGKTPTGLEGSIAESKDNYNTHTKSGLPCFACNIVDKVTWKCVAEVGTGDASWEKQDVYIEPAPENVPVLCTTIEEFERNFGDKPYRWERALVNGTKETTDGLNARMANPIFTAVAGAPTYAYAESDFEKSYIYAKEIINIGIPVLYENVCSRDNSGMKELPSVTAFYSALGSCYDELLDKGEYSAKYITSGAYPTFEYKGGTHYEGSFSDPGNFDYTAVESGETSSRDVFTPNCADTFHDVPIGGPQSLVVSFSYIPYSWSEDDTYDATGEEISTAGATPITLGYSAYVNRNTHYYNSVDEKSWTAVPGSSVSASIVIGPDGYVESGAEWGGAGNTIELEPFGFRITYNNGVSWDWEGTSTYIATATKEVTVEDEADTAGTALSQKMISVAQERGDSVAFIDHTNNPARELIGGNSVYEVLKTVGEGTGFTDGEFGALFTPWASYTTVKEAIEVPAMQIMPASFGYLLSLGKSLRNNPNWLAIAGVARGLVPYIQSLNTVQRLSNTIADAYQPRDNVAINPITNIKPYGLTIWGNRTLKKNVGNITATAMLNIRNLISDVKKVTYTTAKSLMFEQNSDVLWVNFKAGITPLLDQMLSGQGLSGYKVIRGVTTEKAKVVANIKLYPLYAVESFEITVVISDEEVSVS